MTSSGRNPGAGRQRIHALCGERGVLGPFRGGVRKDVEESDSYRAAGAAFPLGLRDLSGRDTMTRARGSRRFGPSVGRRTEAVQLFSLGFQVAGARVDLMIGGENIVSSSAARARSDGRARVRGSSRPPEDRRLACGTHRSHGAQAAEFRPTPWRSPGRRRRRRPVRRRPGHRGPSGCSTSSGEHSDIVLNGISGAAGLAPSLAASNRGRTWRSPTRSRSSWPAARAGGGGARRPLVLARGLASTRRSSPSCGRCGGRRCGARDHRLGRRLATCRSRPSRRCALPTRSRTRLADGPEDNRRLGDARQQGPRGDRGAPPLRRAARPGEGARAPPEPGARAVRTVDGRCTSRRARRHAHPHPERPHVPRGASDPVPWLDSSRRKAGFEAVGPLDATRCWISPTGPPGRARPSIVYNAGDEAAVEAFRLDATPFRRIPSLVEELLSLAWRRASTRADEVLAWTARPRARRGKAGVGTVWYFYCSRCRSRHHGVRARAGALLAAKATAWRSRSSRGVGRSSRLPPGRHGVPALLAAHRGYCRFKATKAAPALEQDLAEVPREPARSTPCPPGGASWWWRRGPWPASSRPS